jgi:hypothetical protein
MMIVPIDKKPIQNQYIFFETLFVRSSTVRVIVLGEASRVVRVVLNMVVNAAIPMMIYIDSPIVPV